MESIINSLTNEEKEVLDKFEFLDLLDLVEKLEDYLQDKCLTDEGINKEGKLILSIIEKL